MEAVPLAEVVIPITEAVETIAEAVMVLETEAEEVLFAEDMLSVEVTVVAVVAVVDMDMLVQ